MVADKDQSKTESVMSALLKMKKLDIEGLKKAYKGSTAGSGT
jgi:hypothetical protein